MKKLFTAIRNGDFDNVMEIINKKPELVNCTAKQPPKKDDGQSPLQVAFKVGRLEIAKFLIENGANINFIEQSEVNEWNTPVLHDCIRATIFSCRTLVKDTKVFDFAFLLLNEMLKKGANPNSLDTYGNSCLARAVLDAKQMIDHPLFEGETSWAGNGLTDEERNMVLNQIRSVFKSLIDMGADPNISNSRRESAIVAIENYRLEKYNLF